MNIQQKRLYQRICAYSPDDPASSVSFTQRLARENRWSLGFAHRVVDEYKRFMFLAIVAGHEVTPSDEVDEAWHLHLVYTREYWDEFCGKVLEKPVHHGPTKGGRSESDRFHDQYEQTLSSYRRWFGEAPPPDIWPTAESRFSRHGHSVRVNTGSAWIVPKPRLRFPGSRSTAWVAGACIVPLCFGLGNPLDMRGPEFLAFYAVVAGMALAAAFILRIALRRDDPGADTGRSLSPYEVACLARGVPGVLQSAMAAMVADERLQVLEIAPTKFGPISLGSSTYRLKAESLPVDADEVEVALAERAMRPEGAEPKEVLEFAKPTAEAIESKLRGLGLLTSSETFVAERCWPTIILAGAWLLGATKLVVGLSRDKPVGILVVALIVGALIILAFQKLPRRTRAGDRRLKQLESDHQTLRMVAPAESAPLPATDLILAAGLFGITAIDDPELLKLNAAMKTVPASDGGAAIAGCGGGGCGGGGCGGGCGGCGG